MVHSFLCRQFCETETAVELGQPRPYLSEHAALTQRLLIRHEERQRRELVLPLEACERIEERGRHNPLSSVIRDDDQDAWEVLRALLGPVPCNPDVARELVRELASRLRPAVVLEIEVERAVRVQKCSVPVRTDPAVAGPDRALRQPLCQPVSLGGATRLDQRAEELADPESVREI